MDLTWVSGLVPIVDHLTSFMLVLIVLGTGYRGMWVYGGTMKQRLADKDERIAEKDKEIADLKSKSQSQERLIDRLSGLAERSTELARPLVVSEVQHHRRERALEDVNPR